MEADYTKWVDAGLLVDVSPYMKKYTNMVDYYNSVDPGVMFYASGDNGIYRIPGDGAVNTEQNLGINLFQDLFARKDAANIANTEETTELFEKVKENSRDAYAKTIEKKNPDAYTVNNDLGTDIGDAMKEYTWGVIGGGKSLDDWDSYVDKINGLGLQDVLDELKEIHGKQVEDYQKYLEEYNK